MANINKRNERDGDEGQHVIIRDTGSTLHVFRNAKGVWSDHTGKEYTAVVITVDGEEERIYCGSICYSVPESESDIPSADELLEKHNVKYSGHLDNKWGYEA
jgi:hypothetical protein